MQKAGDEAEDAEENVDDGIGRADAALDPDCSRCQYHVPRIGCVEYKEDVPGSGGKRMAITPRKMSAEQHMVSL